MDKDKFIEIDKLVEFFQKLNTLQNDFDETIENRNNLPNRLQTICKNRTPPPLRVTVTKDVTEDDLLQSVKLIL